jgi:hypothetical protein
MPSEISISGVSGTFQMLNGVYTLVCAMSDCRFSHSFKVETNGVVEGNKGYRSVSTVRRKGDKNMERHIWLMFSERDRRWTFWVEASTDNPIAFSSLADCDPFAPMSWMQPLPSGENMNIDGIAIGECAGHPREEALHRLDSGRSHPSPIVFEVLENDQHSLRKVRVVSIAL